MASKCRSVLSGAMEVYLNEQAVTTQVKKINASVLAINADKVSRVPTVNECSGIRLSDYYNKIIEIGKLLEDYREMLQKDCKEIQEAVKSYQKTDAEVAKIFTVLLNRYPSHTCPTSSKSPKNGSNSQGFGGGSGGGGFR